MTTEKIHVGIMGANVRYGWGRDTHIPALSALPEFEITAVCTSRHETADETAKHFGIPHAFADPCKMVQHPDVDLVSICVRVAFHHQLGMAALNAGKHLYCEWPLAATTEQAQQMRDLAVRKGSHHMAGLQARGARAFNRVRDLVADGYVGKVLSCTMIVSTPTWGTEFTHDWTYMADRSNGNTLLTSPGDTQLTRWASASGEFNELSSVVANQRQRVKIAETGETIQMTSPDQGSSAASSKAARSRRSTSRTAPPTGWGSCSRSMAPRATCHRAGRPAPGDLHTGLRVHSARCADGQAVGGSLDTGEPPLGSTRDTRRGSLTTSRSRTCGWLKAFAKERPSAQTSTGRQTPAVA
jgi:predicted dehydrogenase